jgi:hypothetical protein
MNLSTCRHNITNDGKIEFPALQCWNPVTRVATIAAQVGGKRVSCRIASTVLQKKFDVSPDTSMEAVTEYRLLIETAARKLIEKEAYEKDGSILIKYKDL